MSNNHLIQEPARSLPVVEKYDVVVCGGGPAGIASAITAGRAGAKTCIVEHQGFLGGVWTAGLLSLILGVSEKPSLVDEIRSRLREKDAMNQQRDLYDAEAMKRLLEEMCEEAGVEIRLYTRLVSAIVSDRRISHIVLEAKDGRFAIQAETFVDATGDGDLGARAGCGFDFGRSSDGLGQPMTMMALVAGVPAEVRDVPFAKGKSSTCIPKDKFYAMLSEAGCPTSYTGPSLFPLPNELCCLMINHEYEYCGLKSKDLTKASISARAEISRVMDVLTRFPGWEKLRLVATASYIGVREGRRIHGIYHVSLEDMMNGVRHEDAITRTKFPIDIHSVRRSEGGRWSPDAMLKPIESYDIPLRALLAADVDNLAMAGRCISGDFYAHASYRQ
ncbi:MAG: FAD-dependent oxidoreductase, partial [Candidatus Methylacidiphilales bacterium]